VVPHNKFEVLRSKIMQCGVEEKMIRKIGVVEVECFKYGKKRHKCKECSWWMRKKKAVYIERPQKVQQKERLACPIRGEVQQEWKRSLVEELRKRAEKHYGKGVPEEAYLLELGWCTEKVIVMYV